MRKIKTYKLKLISIIGFLFLMNSCDYLEVDHYFMDMLTQEEAFQDKTYTEQWLWNTYSYLSNQEMGTKGNTAFSFASDEALFSDWEGGKLIEYYQAGEYSASRQLKEDRWGHLYRGIRQASIFMANVDKCPELSKNIREDYRAQARFLRAYFYWMLIKQYGPVPILPDAGLNISKSYAELEVPRNTYDECVEYITTELRQAARVLPMQRQGNWIGQPTKGAALAARAKVLLYAASPLYNGNSEYFNFTSKEGEALISQKYNEEKWAKAAVAAKEVMDLGLYELHTAEYDPEKTTALAANVPTASYPAGAGGIDPLESYRQVFNGEVLASNNRELVFLRPNSTIVDLLKHVTPKSLNGWNSHAVTLKQVDAYYLNDGKDIGDPSAQHPYKAEGFTTSNNDVPLLASNVSLQYAWREPRFYASIAFPGSIWPNKSTSLQHLKNKQIFYYKGDIDGKSNADIEHYVLTGIAFNKFISDMDSFNEGGQTKHKVEPTIRYADVLLWYCEALNQLTGTHQIESFDSQNTITVSRDVNAMQQAFSRIRFRAGLPDLDASEYADKNTFLNKLKRERQIEFFLEGARYFDLRRWKDAEVQENMKLMKYDVDVTNADQADFYNRVPLWINKKFEKRMYLWPIPKSDLKMNSMLVQNPGWE
ncbi:RagB/SusD family nutrient uptake outer membrane protein [Prolixibacteraceae bacterium JC049]|nr:RagB/SusD family nutrient uptake outer membrane protein [Prolixibacteraceae bacterium JC049]